GLRRCSRRAVPGIIGVESVFVMLPRLDDKDGLANAIGGGDEHVLLHGLVAWIGLSGFGVGQRAVKEGIVTLTDGVIGNAILIGQREELSEIPCGSDVNASKRRGNRGADRRVGGRVGNGLHGLD